MYANISPLLLHSILALLLTSCGEEASEAEQISGQRISVSAILPEEDAGSGSVLSRYDLENDNPEVISLPEGLTEISGLAATSDGRIFAHNDETGVVRRVSLGEENASEWFSVGSVTLSEDLEGIAVVGEKFYMINSKGDIFAFSEGEPGGSVEFEQIRTDLSGKFDVEGLCYDPGSNSLLLACKEFPGGGLDEKEHRAVYAFSIGSGEIESEPRFVLPIKELEKHLGLKKFRPSGIERHPETGNYVLLSGNDPAIIELSPTGDIVAAYMLDPDIHPQPEGITFGPDGSLLIASEGGGLVRFAQR